MLFSAVLSNRQSCFPAARISSKFTRIAIRHHGCSMLGVGTPSPLMLDQSKAGRGGEIKATSKPEPAWRAQNYLINEERGKNTTNKDETLTKNATNTQANPSLINTSVGCRRGWGVTTRPISQLSPRGWSDNASDFSVVTNSITPKSSLD